MKQTFGQAFGELIRTKRGQEGLTQKELAIKAFDDESKVRRINEIEKGAVRRPQAATIDALVVALDIRKEELDACKQNKLFTSQEQTTIGLSRQLMENLALRFEHENPDASDEELFAYLKSKAEELKLLKDRLQSLEVTTTTLDNQIKAADAALELGQFDEADEILAAAEDIQQERTLKEIHIQSKIRFTRGDTALFNGQRDAALSHYIKAAEYFYGFDKNQVGLILEEAAGQIYEYERRSFSPNFEHAITLATRALELSSLKKSRVEWVNRKYRLALLQQVQARALNETSLLNDAIQNCKEALEYADTEIEDFDYASLVVLLGNCYLARGEHSDSPNSDDLDRALDVFERAIQDSRMEKLQHRCYLHNSIYAAYSSKSERANEDTEGTFAKKAKKALLRAIELSAQENQLDVWSICQYNLGGMLATAARESSDPAIANFLRVQSISAFMASVEAYPATLFNPQVARTQLALGRVFLDQARFLTGETKEMYLIRSIHANEVALTMFNEGTLDWARAQFSAGLAFFLHAEMAAKEIALSDLEKALSHFEAAQPGYRAHAMKFKEDLKKLMAAQKETTARLKKLRET